MSGSPVKFEITWVEMVDGKPADPGCEAFVEPQLVPPVHGDKVTKPLVSQLCRVTLVIVRGILSPTGILGEGAYRGPQHKQFGSYSGCPTFPRRKERQSSGRSRVPSFPWHPWPRSDQHGQAVGYGQIHLQIRERRANQPSEADTRSQRPLRNNPPCGGRIQAQTEPGSEDHE